MFIDQLSNHDLLVQLVQGLCSKIGSFLHGSVGKRVASFGSGALSFSFGLVALGAAELKLELMIDIDWKKGPDLPRGFQDSDGGIIDDTLISVGGFCSGQNNLPEK